MIAEPWRSRGRFPRLFGGLMVSLLVSLSLAACGSSGEHQVTQMTEVIVKTASSTRGQAALAQAGVDVSGPLSCTTQPSGENFTVSCSGTSIDGRAVTVTGTATSVPGGSSVAGNFVGTAGGQQVFSTECLGDC
jgi:hypothetical protein